VKADRSGRAQTIDRSAPSGASEQSEVQMTPRVPESKRTSLSFSARALQGALRRTRTLFRFDLFLLGALLVLVVSSLASSLARGTTRFKRARADGNQKANAPHGALAMADQLAVVMPWLKPQVSVPAGVSPQFFQSIVPAQLPNAESIVALGRALYFEPRLSKDGTVACATCHDASRGFTDRRGTSEGIGDAIGKRNAPTTLNALFLQTQFWDGRAPTLEEQAKLPITNPIEMGQPDGTAAIAAIAQNPEYQRAFQAAFGRAPTFDDLAVAIAAFERTLVFIDAPFDRFGQGDAAAISDDAKAGFALFNGKARCTACHQINGSSPVGSDSRFHNIGVSARHQDFEGLVKRGLAALAKDDSREALDELALQTDLSELGRFIVTRNRSDIGAFRTSQLRNVGVTAPYMHDGSLQTLWDVMDHYNKGGEPNPFLDGGMEPLNLTEREIDQLVAFMFSLTDKRLASQNQAEEARQRALAAKQRPMRNVALATRKEFLFEARANNLHKGSK
jgi:cytochrome c peroxidase